MNDLRHRVLGLLTALALIGGAATAVADEAPDEEEDAEVEAEELAEDDQDLEEAAEDEQALEDEETAEENEERPEGWETSLRDRISPVMNHEGAPGFHGIASADSPGSMNFQVGLFGRATGGTDFIRYNDEHGGWTGSALLNGWFNEYFGAHFRVQARNSVNTFGRPQAMLSQGDVNLGGIARYPVGDGISLGGDLGLFVPSQFGNAGLTPSGTSVRPRAIATFDFDAIAGRQADMYIPVVAHANLGYRFDNSENTVDEGVRIDRIERHAYGVSAYDGLEMGVGVEFPLPYVTPFVGWELDIPVNATGDVCADGRPLDCVEDVGGSAYPQKMSLGAKAEPIGNLGLHAGIDIGLTADQAEGVPPTLPYEFGFGVSWNIDPSAQAEPVDLEIEYAEPERGAIEGLVLDRETGDPIEGARIEYPGADASAQLTAEDSGLFRSYDFVVGSEMELAIDHPDYETQEVRHQLDEAGERLEVALEPLPDPAVVSGTVLDQEGEPLGGVSVEFRTADGDRFEVDADDQGRFDAEVQEAGPVTLVAEREGFLPGGQRFEVERGDEIGLDVALSGVEEWMAEVTATEIVTDGSIDFAEGEATLRDEDDELLDQVAALLLRHPELESIEIQGHTADQGEDDELTVLSQERAEAVRDALVDRGVDPERLQVEGYGATQPLLPNTSSRNREMNRRIEFHIVE